VGELRVAPGASVRDPRTSVAAEMLLPLVAGFFASAAFVTAAVAGASGGLEHSGVAMAITAGIVAVLAALELTSTRRSPVRRQTRRQWLRVFGRRAGALMWGLDTGSMVTTVRTSFGSHVVLILCAVGAADGWAGVAYAVGFCLPLVGLLFAPLWRSATAEHPVGTPGISPRAMRLLLSALMIGVSVSLVT
jgi:hypothetical protein